MQSGWDDRYYPHGDGGLCIVCVYVAGVWRHSIDADADMSLLLCFKLGLTFSCVGVFWATG